MLLKTEAYYISQVLSGKAATEGLQIVPPLSPILLISWLLTIWPNSQSFNYHDGQNYLKFANSM